MCEGFQSCTKSKGINGRGIITAGINRCDPRPRFQPASLIRSTRSIIGSPRWNVGGGVSRTNKHTHPLSLALTLIYVRQVHHPVLSQVPVNGCQYAGLAGVTGARRGVDEGLISGERLLCFSNDGLNEYLQALSVHPRHHLEQQALVNTGAGANSSIPKPPCSFFALLSGVNS